MGRDANLLRNRPLGDAGPQFVAVLIVQEQRAALGAEKLRRRGDDLAQNGVKLQLGGDGIGHFQKMGFLVSCGAQRRFVYLLCALHLIEGGDDPTELVAARPAHLPCAASLGELNAVEQATEGNTDGAVMCQHDAEHH